MGRLPAVVRALVGAPRQSPAIAVEELSSEDSEQLARIEPQHIASLPYGVIELDRDGVVTSYGAYEAAAADRHVTEVVGRRFVDVAPCVRVRRFTDAAEAFRTRALDRVMRFVFPCFGALSVVTVRLFFDAGSDRLWLFVSRRAPAEGRRHVANPSDGEPMPRF